MTKFYWYGCCRSGQRSHSGLTTLNWWNSAEIFISDLMGSVSESLWRAVEQHLTKATIFQTWPTPVELWHELSTIVYRMEPLTVRWKTPTVTAEVSDPISGVELKYEFSFNLTVYQSMKLSTIAPSHIWQHCMQSSLTLTDFDLTSFMYALLCSP